MTTPHERTRAVLQTTRFLQQLVDAAKTPGVPDDVRREAHRLLRHYPGRSEMAIASGSCPAWFGPVEEISPG